MSNPSSELRFAWFWLFITWMLKWGWLYAFLILPVECIVVRFCPDVKIFGMNMLRDALAEQYLCPLFGDGGYHVAGALTDFKKMILYGFLLGQFSIMLFAFLGRGRIQDGQLSNLSVDSASAKLVYEEVRWNSRFRIAFGIILAFAICVFYLKRQLWTPEMTCHIFGPAGKGLISNGHPGMLGIESLMVVLYRLWYLVAIHLFAIALVVLLPWYFEGLFAKPREGQKTQDFTIRLFRNVGAPSFALIFIMIVLSTTRDLMVGEIGGVSRGTIIGGACVFGVWILFGAIKSIGTRPPQGKAPDERFFNWLADVARQLYEQRNQPILWLVSCVFGTSLAGFLIGAATMGRTAAAAIDEPEKTLMMARSGMNNHLTEFMYFEIADGLSFWSRIQEESKSRLQKAPGWPAKKGASLSTEELRSFFRSLFPSPDAEFTNLGSRLDSEDNLALLVAARAACDACNEWSNKNVQRWPNTKPIPFGYARDFLRQYRSESAKALKKLLNEKLHIAPINQDESWQLWYSRWRNAIILKIDAYDKAREARYAGGYMAQHDTTMRDKAQRGRP
ncbi:MAG: hypothetical protein IH991_12590 [Planctomycetes bacterium]|nr:hypothetical protein [Planctomycetota bacterium]